MSDRVAPSAPLEPVAAVEDGELEQKETKEEVVAQVNVIEQGDAMGKLTPHARQEDARRALTERIAASSLLPAGLKSRLAEVVAADGGVEEAVRVLEESLPSALRMSEREVLRPAHPAGEAFFRGDAGAVSEEEAESIARGQLARSGMLRGQRVRVGD
jgi:hypothetical protein